jgi:putative ABC transport system permease protein
MGVPLLRGRAFTVADDARAAPVAIIDETMAAKFWPGEDPIGKRITIGEQAADSSLIYRTVVGVAKNVRHYALRTASRIQVYVPVRQTLGRFGPSLTVVLKTSVPPASLIAPLRRTVASIDPRVPVFDAMAERDYVDGSIAGERALGVITSWLAAVAAIVTAVGLFGIVSYAVVQRRREIALRMALGARPMRVVGLMTWGGVSLALIGVTVGLVAAAVVSRLVKAFLFGVGPLDPGTWLWATAGLVAVAFVAAAVPAMRARRYQPALVLRED